MPPRRSLYVSRPLINGQALRAWARAAGFTQALPPEDMHVTIAFSRQAMDWSAVPPDTRPVAIELGHDGPQRVKQLGKAIVLRFEAPALAARWRAFRAAGASWDHADYQPHVTITYRAPARPPTRIEDIEPYHGPLRFGPERFQPVNEDWSGQVRETPLAASRRTVVLARRAS